MKALQKNNGVYDQHPEWTALLCAGADALLLMRDLPAATSTIEVSVCLVHVDLGALLTLSLRANWRGLEGVFRSSRSRL